MGGTGEMSGHLMVRHGMAWLQYRRERFLDGLKSMLRAADIGKILRVVMRNAFHVIMQLLPAPIGLL